MSGNEDLTMMDRTVEPTLAEKRAAGRMAVRALGDDRAKLSDVLEMLGIKPYKAHARSTQAGTR